MSKHPLLILCVYLVLGIFAQEFWNFGERTAFTLLIVSGLLLIMLFFKNIWMVRSQKFLVGIFFFCLGIFIHFLDSKPKTIPQTGKEETFVFSLVQKLNSNEKNRRYEVEMHRGKDNFSAVISIPKTLPELDYSHYYRAKIYLNKVEPPANDYQFDYSKYLSRKKIYHQGYVPKSLSVSEVRNLSFADKIRENRLVLLQKIDKLQISPKSREFLKGIILSDRTEMDSQTVQDFSRTGLVHILAISGSHIVIIFGIIYLIFLQIFTGRFKKFAIIFGLAFIWIFAVYIGYGNSVVRSCIMITIYYIYFLLQRKPDLLHSMSLAALIILIGDSQQLFDVGFQLSFLAVFGIYWLNQPILKFLPKPKNKFQNFLVNIPSITLAAQIATLPLVLYYFHQFSFIALLANLVIIPLSEIIIVFSLLMTFFVGFNFNITILERFYDVFISNILQAIHWFSGFESAFSKNIPMSFVELLLLLVALYFLRPILTKFTIKNLFPFAVVILTFFIVRSTLNYDAVKHNEALVHHHFKARYFSVKQGNMIYFYLPQNTDLEKATKYVIDPYLTSRRVKNLTILELPPDANSVSYGGKHFNLK